MVAPVIIAALVAEAAKAVGERIAKKKQDKKNEKELRYRTQEQKRATKSALYNDVLDTKAEHEEHNRKSEGKLIKGKSRSHHDTANLVRKAIS